MDSAARTVTTRVLRAAITVIFVVTVVFVILRISGDPVRLMLPEDATPDQIEGLRRELGLDDSVPVQYVRYWSELFSGDFGQSMRFRRPAVELVQDRFPATLQLAAASFALSTVLGLGLGVLAAVRRGTLLDRVLMAMMSLMQSAPSFFLGIVLILVFSVKLNVLPTSGTGSPKYLILPAVTLSALTLASLVRITRSSLLEVLRADYVRTARAKGLTEQVVVLRHALRNAALPVVTVLGLELAGLMTGTVIVETVFAWPGVGRLAVEAVTSRDYPVVQACVLVIALVFVLVNLVVDLSYIFLDPRVRNG